MSKKIIFSFGIGIFISVIALYFSCKDIPFQELLLYLKKVHYLWIIPSILAALTTYIFRTLRWKIILSKSNYSVSFKNCFNLLMIGFMINNIFPARLGGIARPLILYQQEKVPFTTGVATVVAERVFDILLIIGSFILITFFWQIDPSFKIKFGAYHLSAVVLQGLLNKLMLLSVLLLCVILILVITPLRNLLIRFFESISKITERSLGKLFGEKIQAKLEAVFFSKIIQMIQHVSQGFSLIRYPKQVFICIVLTFLIWVIQASGYYFMMLGSPEISLSFLNIFLVMVIISLFIALPSAPGFWGIWEAGGIFALALFGVKASSAMGFTLINHAIQVFPIILVGLGSTFFTGVNILKISKETMRS